MILQILGFLAWLEEEESGGMNSNRCDVSSALFVHHPCIVFFNISTTSNLFCLASFIEEKDSLNCENIVQRSIVFYTPVKNIILSPKK